VCRTAFRQVSSHSLLVRYGQHDASSSRGGRAARPTRATRGGRAAPVARAPSTADSQQAAPNAPNAPNAQVGADVVAQIAEVGPALAAILAAINAPAPAPAQGSTGGSVQEEPEREPGVGDEDNDADEASASGKPSLKIDTRNIKVAKFDGTVSDGNFDAKARDFVEELKEQLEDAQTLADQVWTNEVKKAVLNMFLTGMALRRFRDWRRSNPVATFEDSCDGLVHEFRPHLLGVDVADKMKQERKRWSETYREFADRLLQMADALECGKTVPGNARHALLAFVRNAYPEFTDFLESKIDLESDHTDQELKSVISILTRKAKTDGRMPDRA
jgi:hypothetical protein